MLLPTKEIRRLHQDIPGADPYSDAEYVANSLTRLKVDLTKDLLNFDLLSVKSTVYGFWNKSVSLSDTDLGVTDCQLLFALLHNQFKPYVKKHPMGVIDSSGCYEFTDNRLRRICNQINDTYRLGSLLNGWKNNILHELLDQYLKDPACFDDSVKNPLRIISAGLKQNKRYKDQQL